MLPTDAVVLMDNGVGLSPVAALDFVGEQEPWAAVGGRPKLERRS